MEISTCPICDTQLEHIQDGILHYCKCKSMGIDCTPEYIRWIGVLSKESNNYEDWAEKHKETLSKLRLRYNQNKEK
jgi:hypothetical protein